MSEEIRKLLEDILAEVVCRDAGNGDDPFTYFWQTDWDRLEARIKEQLNASVDK